MAIKQTLYRTSGDSPIVKALERAAANGKEVTVLVELKARFDEARNVTWARRLEDAGCHVIYGIVGFKTHAKALLIVRRESGRIRRYVHLATGNYNDRTAKLYSDVGLMTSNRDVATDVAARVQPADRLLGGRRLVEAHRRAAPPEAEVHRPDRARDRGLDARPAGIDHGQGQFAPGPGGHPRAVPGQPGGRQGDAQHPRHLLPAARRAGRLGQHRGPLDTSIATWSTRGFSTSAMEATRKSISPAPTGCTATWSGGSKSSFR